MLFPDKLVRYLDVPQNFDPEVGGAFYRAELEDLARELAGRGARPLEPEALRASIAAYNEKPRARARALRAAPRAAVEGPDGRALRRAARGARAAGRGVTSRCCATTSTARRADRRAPADGPGARRADRLVLRAAAAGADQDARAGGLLHRRRRLRAGAPLDPGRRSRRPATRSTRSSTRSSTDSIASPVRYSGDERKGRELVERVRASKRRGRALLRAELLRPGAARPADAVAARRARRASPGPLSSTPRTPASSR